MRKSEERSKYFVTDCRVNGDASRATANIQDVTS